MINSREQKRVGNVWRRRSCSRCEALFTTIEAPDLSTSVRVRSSKAPTTLTPFNRDVLFMSLVRALGHRKDAIEAADALTTTTIGQLLKHHSGALVEASMIRDATHTTLMRFDKVAAISYAAYHAD